MEDTAPETTYISWSAATQPGHGIDEVLLHLCAETHTGHQLLQQLAILHLQKNTFIHTHNTSYSPSGSLCPHLLAKLRPLLSLWKKKTRSILSHLAFLCLPLHGCQLRTPWLPLWPPPACLSYTSWLWGPDGAEAASVTFHMCRNNQEISPCAHLHSLNAAPCPSLSESFLDARRRYAG